VSAANSGLLSLGWSSSPNDGGGIDYTVALYLAPALVLAAIGLTLIWQRERLAARWFSDEPLGDGLDAVSALRVGIILLGLAFCVVALQTALLTILRPWILAASDQATFGAGYTDPQPLAAWLPVVVARAAQLLLGAGLVWFAKPLAMLLWSHEVVRTPRERPQSPACPTCGQPFNPDDYVPGAAARCSGCGQPLEVDGA
jgi:hypothetical protein